MYGTFIVKATTKDGRTVYLKTFMPNGSNIADSVFGSTDLKDEAKVFSTSTASDSTGLLWKTYSNGEIVDVESVKISDEIAQE